MLYRSRSEEQNKQVQPVHRILQKRAAFDKTGLLKKKKKKKGQTGLALAGLLKHGCAACGQWLTDDGVPLGRQGCLSLSATVNSSHRLFYSGMHPEPILTDDRPAPLIAAVTG
jgi:hypothetical protein